MGQVIFRSSESQLLQSISGSDLNKKYIIVIMEIYCSCMFSHKITLTICGIVLLIHISGLFVFVCDITINRQTPIILPIQSVTYAQLPKDIQPHPFINYLCVSNALWQLNCTALYTLYAVETTQIALDTCFCFN